MNIENQRSKIGQLPGSITYTGNDSSDEIKIIDTTRKKGGYKKHMRRTVIGIIN